MIFTKLRNGLSYLKYTFGDHSLTRDTSTDFMNIIKLQSHSANGCIVEPANTHPNHTTNPEVCNKFHVWNLTWLPQSFRNAPLRSSFSNRASSSSHTSSPYCVSSAPHFRSTGTLIPKTSHKARSLSLLECRYSATINLGLVLGSPNSRFLYDSL